MGTKMGPSFACLFVGYLEEKMFEQYQGPIPDLYKRYIDDVFGVSSDSDEELSSFISFVSNFHPAIKYTFTVSDQNLSFLDIDCHIVNNVIVTSVYYKPTDAHCYLNYTSSHPESCKNAIPKSQFLRLRRICSNDDDFGKQCERMSEFFEKRGYPKEVVQKAATSTSLVNRSTALIPKNKSSKDRVPLVLTYHPHNKAIRDILIRNFKSIVLKDEEMAQVFGSLPMTAYRKGKSLRQHLVKSSCIGGSKSTYPQYRGTRKCGRPICNTCPHTWETDEVVGPDNTFVVRGGFTCVTENVIYAIKCKICSMVYIGESYRRLGDRFAEHILSAKKNGNCPVGKHFNRPGHKHTDMMVTVLLQTNCGEKKRQFMEQRIMHFLGTLWPRGINVKKQFYQ